MFMLNLNSSWERTVPRSIAALNLSLDANVNVVVGVGEMRREKDSRDKDHEQDHDDDGFRMLEVVSTIYLVPLLAVPYPYMYQYVRL